MRAHVMGPRMKRALCAALADGKEKVGEKKEKKLDFQRPREDSRAEVWRARSGGVGVWGVPDGLEDGGNR